MESARWWRDGHLKQEVLERTNLPAFLALFKNVVFPNITLVGNSVPYLNTPTYKIMFQTKEL
jgi:hypothetical protein